jgi:hypothetical protein
MVLHTHHHQLIILDHHLRQCRNQTVAQSSTCHPRLIRTILKIWDYRNRTKLTSKYRYKQQRSNNILQQSVTSRSLTSHL